MKERYAFILLNSVSLTVNKKKSVYFIFIPSTIVTRHWTFYFLLQIASLSLLTEVFAQVFPTALAKIIPLHFPSLSEQRTMLFPPHTFRWHCIIYLCIYCLATHYNTCSMKYQRLSCSLLNPQHLEYYLA